MEVPTSNRILIKSALNKFDIFLKTCTDGSKTQYRRGYAVYIPLKKIHNLRSVYTAEILDMEAALQWIIAQRKM